MYIREQKKQLTIKSIKKVFLLVVLNLGLVLSIFNNSAHAGLPRAIYGKCYYTEEALISGAINHWNSSNQAIALVRHMASGSYNPTNDFLTLIAENTNTGATTSTTFYMTEPCNKANQNLFENVPIQDIYFQGFFLFMFVTGVYFGYRFFKL